jgi:hypothetical protein
MSLSIDSAALLIEHNQWETNLQKIVEITTPLGWAHGFVNYLKVMKKWRWKGLPQLTGDTMATTLLLHMSWNAYRCLAVSTSNLTVEHCLHANNVVYITICDILQKEEVDNNDEVTYHAASIQFMQAYLWKGMLAQHVLYLLGGLSIIPAKLCADRDMCWNQCAQEGEGSSTTGFPE